MVRDTVQHSVAGMVCLAVILWVVAWVVMGAHSVGRLPQESVEEQEYREIKDESKRLDALRVHRMGIVVK